MWLTLLVLGCSAPVPDPVEGDGDGDGVSSDRDCDDADPDVYPGAEDVWYDGIDADCGGDDDFDADRDGVPRDADCDDADADRSPSQPEIWYDGIDSDCGGDSDWDADADGFTPPGSPEGDPTDCDDADAEVSPAVEVNSATALLGVPGDLTEAPLVWSPGAMVRPSDPSFIDQHHATVAAGDDGRFAVAWQLGKTYGNPFPLVRLVDALGPVGYAVPSSELGLGGIKPDIEAHPGGYVVAFEETQAAIWLTPLDLDGRPTGPPVLATAPGSLVEAPDLALYPDGTGLVAYTAVGGDAGEGTHRITRFGPDLLPIGDPIDLQEGGRTIAEVAVRADGGWAAVATRQPPDRTHLEVYGRVVDGAGCVTNFRADQAESDFPSRPTLAVADDGSFAVTWRGKVGVAEGEGVYGRFFDARGNARTDAIALSGEDLDANRPVVAIWGDLAVFAWEGEADGGPLPAPLDVQTWTWSIAELTPVTRPQRLSAVGSLVSAERPAIAIAPKGDGTATALVTWEQVGFDTRVAAVPVLLDPP